MNIHLVLGKTSHIRISKNPRYGVRYTADEENFIQNAAH